VSEAQTTSAQSAAAPRGGGVGAAATTATMRRASAEAAGAPVGGASAAAELHDFLVTLLEQQAGLVGGVAGAVYLVGSSLRQAGIAAVYPVGAEGGGTLDRAMLTRMERIGAKAASEGRGVVEAVTLTEPTGLYHAEATHRLIGCPLAAADAVHGASVLLVPLSGPGGRMPAAEGLERLRLTAARFEAFLWKQQCLGEAHAKLRLRETLELLDAAQQGGDAATMGSLFCHELARRFGCTRVSLGLVRAGGQLKLTAVSGADELDRRGAAATALEAAMEECADQDAEIVYPQPPEMQADPALRRVTRAHEELSAKFGPAAILSLPLRVEGDLVGVVVLEREASDPFPPGAIPLMRLIAEFIGPAVWTRRMADRGVLAVMRDRAVEIATIAVGPRYTGAKVLGVLLLLVVLAAALVPIPGRIVAEAETRAAVSRLISPPYPGYLASVNVKPGDTVSEGQVLATLETEELERQLAIHRTSLSKTRTQQADARAKGLQGDADILGQTAEELLERIGLLESQIARAEVRAPIAGRIGRGEVDLLVGAYVTPTDPLLEVIGEEQSVVVLNVDERDIGRVSIGQEGWIAPAGEPSLRLPIRVTRIRPVAEPVEGGNVYKVEAVLVDGSIRVPPGMTATARLKDRRTTVLAWLMRPLVDRIRMELWW